MSTVFSISKIPESAVELVTLSNRYGHVKVAPAIGGRIISIRLESTGEELLWHNENISLQTNVSGAAYDPNFYGGIDELLPCDEPERIDGIDCPDHGELWTTPLQWEIVDDVLKLQGVLPRFGLTYTREMHLSPDKPEIISQYRIGNPTAETRHFLWKLHAALPVNPGDLVECPAVYAKPVDAAYTTCKSMEPFLWPYSGESNKSVIPESNGTCEFLYLYELSEGTMSFIGKESHTYFTYHFDKAVFPYPWLFQSFGGFDGHEVTVLEPCTNMPLRVNDAMKKEQCASFPPLGELSTTIRISFGKW